MASRDTGLKACQRGHNSAFGANSDSMNMKPMSGIISKAMAARRTMVVGACFRIIDMA